MEGKTIKLKGEDASIGSPVKLSSIIGPVTDLQLLKVVIIAYKALSEEKKVKEDWQEDKITRELLFRIQVHVQKNGVNAFPTHQYPLFLKTPKKGRPPTIDFVFRKGYDESPYFGFECKIVDDRKSSSVRDYIDEGMKRFLSGKYAAAEKLGGMIAYLLNREVETCVLKINELIKKEMGSTASLTRFAIDVDFNEIFRSIHARSNIDFTLYHIFMTFYS
jgi:hypothetical protein